MTRQDVLTVIVSYNGCQKTQRTVEALLTQVARIHIVDNGSDAESLAILARLETQPGLSIERLGVNRGVGYALNRGVHRARQLGCTWLLTMDQDSVVDDCFLSAYQAEVNREPELVCLAPRIAERTRPRDRAGGPISYAITSGNLVRLSVFDQIGPYDEGFFIDCVDLDFCLRLRSAGHAIHRVADAVMRHQLGEPVALPRAIRGYYALHSPARRYYMYRNFMYMVERYLFSFPGFILKLGAGQAILLVLIAFYDPRPMASYRAIARGLWDYATHRSGPYVVRNRGRT